MFSRSSRAAAVGACLALLAGPAAAQDPASPAERLDELERTVAELARELAALREESGAGSEELATLQGELEEAREELARVTEALARAETAGSTKMLLAGDVFVNYADQSDANGSFTAALNPHFYWLVGPRTLFGSGVELELGDDETEVNLEWASLQQRIGKDTTLGVGKFLMPFGFFQENIHSAYINKLPDEPFAVSSAFVTGLAPTHDIGLQLRAPLRLGAVRSEWVVFLTNGPELDLGTSDPRRAGALDFENFEDSNTNKAVGGRWSGRLGAFEVGYSLLVARVGPDGTPQSDVDARLQDVDMAYVGPVAALRSEVDLRLEWIRSDVDPADFGAGLQDNDRSGGYAQLALRPTGLSDGWPGDLELVVRHDVLDQPSGNALEDLASWTLGLNYLAGPTSVFKLAYQDGDDGSSAFLAQYALGF